MCYCDFSEYICLSQKWGEEWKSIHQHSSEKLWIEKNTSFQFTERAEKINYYKHIFTWKTVNLIKF